MASSENFNLIRNQPLFGHETFLLKQNIVPLSLVVAARLLQTRGKEKRLQLSTSCSPLLMPFPPFLFEHVCRRLDPRWLFGPPFDTSPACLPTVSLSCSKKKEGTWMVRDSPNDARKKFIKLLQYVAFVQIKFHQRKAFFLYCTVGSCLKREESNSRPATQTAMAAAAVNYCCPG